MTKAVPGGRSHAGIPHLSRRDFVKTFAAAGAVAPLASVHGAALPATDRLPVPDGTVVAVIYAQLSDGDDLRSVVAVRLLPEDLR